MFLLTGQLAEGGGDVSINWATGRRWGDVSINWVTGRRWGWCFY